MIGARALVTVKGYQLVGDTRELLGAGVFSVFIWVVGAHIYVYKTSTGCTLKMCALYCVN